MNLTALPAFGDNYIWMLDDGHWAVVVDPGDEAPVAAALAQRGLRLTGILVTHHHSDHTGGVDALRPLLQGPVWGPASERIPQPFVPLSDGDRLELLACSVTVLAVPGHTAGHLAFVVQRPEAEADDGSGPLLFCGDTLFSAGCGRLFEGSPAQMHASLSRLCALPEATAVCCAHEYTLSNLRFAAAVEPANVDVTAHTQTCTRLRAQGQPTLPSTIGLERRINPFLRCDQATVIQAARQRGCPSEHPAEVLASLREWKNTFR